KSGNARPARTGFRRLCHTVEGVFQIRQVQYAPTLLLGLSDPFLSFVPPCAPIPKGITRRDLSHSILLHFSIPLISSRKKYSLGSCERSGSKEETRIRKHW